MWHPFPRGQTRPRWRVGWWQLHSADDVATEWLVNALDKLVNQERVRYGVLYSLIVTKALTFGQ